MDLRNAGHISVRITKGHERHAGEFMAQFSGAGQFALLVEALPGVEGRDGVV